MNNVLYTATITPASESPDGETPTLVLVTTENNGFVVWLSGYDHDRQIIDYEPFNRDKAIERGVELGKYKERELAAMRYGARREGLDVVSYCPMCSTVGYLDDFTPCCPDSDRHNVLREIAEQARTGFETIHNKMNQ